MRKPAAIYARVSSDRQKENHTIASQTAALIQHAETQGYAVPPEWVFQDEGYSGASLVRPGLEALRDLAAQGHIEAVLAHSPDRLSRKYAYQILLAEEFNRQGVELVFLKAPSGATPEDQLVVQFQGMIAEYERAQIIERSRRGKRHRAQQGTINVLSGAPYGYRYVKKSDSATAYYEVIEAEADVVRLVFDTYTKEGLSINAIARLLNDRRIPTRTGSSRWERSTVWAMLRNPAYQGKACFGKTERAARKKITRPLRQRGGHSNRCGAHRERPRPEWIEMAVPALVSDATFALAQEQLDKNKRHSPRRTVAPSLLQGMLVCQQCGYALYRSSAQTSKQKLYYYRCIGSDAYRHLCRPVCTNRPIRQDYLDQFVWQRNHSCSRRAGVDSGRDSTPPGSSAEIRSRAQTGAESAPGTDASGCQHGALADRIPREPTDARRTAPTHAGVAQATTGDTIRTDLHGTRRLGSVPISEAYAHTDGVPRAPSREVRNHADTGATENSAALGQGNSRGDRHHYRPAFASDRRFGTTERQSC